MRNSKIEKMFLFVLTILTVGLLVVTPVSALDDDGEEDSGYTDMDDSDSNNTSSNNSSNSSSLNTNNSNSNSNAALSTNSVNNAVKNSTNTTGLPKTGAEDSLPIVVLVAVFGVSAVYAYKRVQDYRDL